MASNISVCSILPRCTSYAAQLLRPNLVEVCVASCSSRGYATQGDDTQGRRPRIRRPMRYGSKLAMRNPEAFKRMQAILGYPDDANVPKVERVTISTLQTFKYLMNTPENEKLLEGMLAYKVTSLNRELMPLLDSTEALLAAPNALKAAADGSTQDSKPAVGAHK